MRMIPWTEMRPGSLDYLPTPNININLVAIFLPSCCTLGHVLGAVQARVAKPTTRLASRTLYHHAVGLSHEPDGCLDIMIVGNFISHPGWMYKGRSE